MFFSPTIFLPIRTLSAIFTLSIQRKHLLISLLALEGIILTLALLISLSAGEININLPIFCLIILTFGACEASLGLALLVSIIRSQGNDIVKNLLITKC